MGHTYILLGLLVRPLTMYSREDGDLFVPERFLPKRFQSPIVLSYVALGSDRAVGGGGGGIYVTLDASTHLPQSSGTSITPPGKPHHTPHQVYTSAI